MSLDFNLRKIPEEIRTIVADFDDPMNGIKRGDKIMNPVTNGLIWAQLAIECGGEITEKNYVEVFERLYIWERVVHALRYDGQGNDLFFTLEDVKNHIGLSTNVFPKISDTKFMQKLRQAVPKA